MRRAACRSAITTSCPDMRSLAIMRETNAPDRLRRHPFGAVAGRAGHELGQLSANSCRCSRAAAAASGVAGLFMEAPTIRRARDRRSERGAAPSHGRVCSRRSSRSIRPSKRAVPRERFQLIQKSHIAPAPALIRHKVERVESRGLHHLNRTHGSEKYGLPPFPRRDRSLRGEGALRGGQKETSKRSLFPRGRSGGPDARAPGWHSLARSPRRNISSSACRCWVY